MPIPYQDEYRNLGRNIAYFRKKKHLTQEGLAMRASMSRPYLGHIEAWNVERRPSLDTLFHLANVLGVPVYRFFLPLEENIRMDKEQAKI